MNRKSFDLRFNRNIMAVVATSMSLFYFTGCSSDNEPGKTDDVPQPELSTESYTVKKSDASRIINYVNTGSRADATASFEMPECPEIPADAKDLNETDEWGGKPNYHWGTPEAGTYYIKAGDKMTDGLNLTGNVTLYIAGELAMSYMNAQNENTIYVLPGGKLTFPSAINPGITVYNYGTIAGNVTIGETAKVYSAVDITECSEFGVNDNAEFYSKGSIIADKVRLNGNTVACAFIAEDEIIFNGKGTMKASYFKAAHIGMNSGNIILDQDGLIDADELNVTDQYARVSVDGDNAVVAARKFSTNNLTWPKLTFAPAVALDFTEAYLATEKKALNDFEFQVSNDNRVAYVPAAGCHPSYPEGTPDPKPEPPTVTIEKITDIDPLDPDHDHGVISATCITFAGNKAYASYHLRGQGQKGCIEVIEDKGEGLNLNSYMISPDYDFNHLIVDNGNIITVGNHAAKGAFIGSLPVDFEASETVRSDFKVKELTTDEVLTQAGKEGEIKAGYKNAGDGNCVIRQGNLYYVNTYRGYGSLNLDFSKVKGTFHNTTGSSKHIAIANGKAAILSLDTYDSASSSSTVNVYDANDSKFETILNSYSAGVISPVDGKNVVAIDGDNIYACLGKGGLVRLNDGKEFHAGTNGKVPANGMAIDENYVYAAMGSFVFVLNKSDLTEVTHYHAASQKSANYIALHDGKIYVAFGEDGIQVFKLNKK